MIYSGTNSTLHTRITISYFFSHTKQLLARTTYLKKVFKTHLFFVCLFPLSLLLFPSKRLGRFSFQLNNETTTHLLLSTQQDYTAKQQYNFISYSRTRSSQRKLLRKGLKVFRVSFKSQTGNVCCSSFTFTFKVSLWSTSPISLHVSEAYCPYRKWHTLQIKQIEQKHVSPQQQLPPQRSACLKGHTGMAAA